jgi:hypothetical protein
VSPQFDSVAYRKDRLAFKQPSVYSRGVAPFQAAKASASDTEGSTSVVPNLSFGNLVTTFTSSK